MSAAPAPVTLVGVVRARNAATVERMLAPPQAAGWTIALWALDEAPPALASHVVGVGPGLRMPLLNACIERSGCSIGTVVVADDDAELVRGDLVRLVDLVERGRLDLAQAAHERGSEMVHRITARARASHARLTTFVEVGPVVVIRAGWRDRVIPFPDDAGMGWGIELLWGDLRAEGARLGVVDAVRVKHLGRVGVEYEQGDERARVARLLAERGLERLDQRTLATWRPWRRSPPWSAGAPPAETRS